MALDASDRALIDAGVLDGLPALQAAPVETAGAGPGELLRLWGTVLRAPTRVLAIGLFAWLLTFNLSVVRGSSMTPGIQDGDRILIDQLSYLLGEAERGDIVVLQYPLDPSLDYIKRIVGLPGDELLIADGEVWVNGERLDEDYLEQADPYTRLRVVVPEGHYFVLGDNRLHSSDSREFGEVPAALVRGKVDLRLWPLSRAGLLR
jgi:signal peptidase I